MFWLIVFNIFFLRNAIYRFLIEELKISLVTLTIMSLYMLIIYATDIVFLFGHENLFSDDSAQAHLIRLIFFMNFIGIGISTFVLIFYFIATYYVYMDMREFIVFHLDGNRVMWQNFIDVTMTRGILKLDVLANLEYFSCFVMFSYNDDISKEYYLWGAIGGLFIVSLLIQAFGGYGTVSQLFYLISLLNSID